ncbi:MAG: PDZ domain-containing protein [Planctomycetaceae bacterium]|nr:PDZ domain-containing protein [Planctomycetaceae bacterium]
MRNAVFHRFNWLLLCLAVINPVSVASGQDDEGGGQPPVRKRNVVVEVEANVVTDGNKTLEESANKIADGPQQAQGESNQRIVTGRVVIIDPNGVRREIDLSDKLQDGSIKWVPGEPGSLQYLLRNLEELDVVPASEQYVIGIHCERAGDTLRRQLKLGDDGLEVRMVVPESGAAAAGIQEGDILLQIDSLPLNDLAVLVKAVRDSEGRELKLKVLRDGDQLDVTVTPKLQKVPEEVIIRGPQEAEDVIEFALPEGEAGTPALRPRQLLLRRIHPGILLQQTPSSNELDKLLKQLEPGIPGPPSVVKRVPGEAESLQNTIKQLQQQVEELKKQQAAFQQALKELQPANPPKTDKADEL